MAEVIERYNNRDRKNLVDQISTLSQTEHEEVFKLLTSLDIPFTQNKNGVFFNFSTVPDAVVKRIKVFIEFCMENKVKLDAYDKRIIECKLHKNYDMASSKVGYMDDLLQGQKGYSEDLQRALSKQSSIIIAGKDAEKEFSDLIQDARTDHRIQALIGNLQKNSLDLGAGNRKKGAAFSSVQASTSTMAKFMTAKKRFSKRNRENLNCETEDDYETQSILMPESPIM